MVVVTDNMPSRWAAVHDAIEWGPHSPTKLVIDARLGEYEDSTRIADLFFLDPRDPVYLDR